MYTTGQSSVAIEKQEIKRPSASAPSLAPVVILLLDYEPRFCDQGRGDATRAIRFLVAFFWEHALPLAASYLAPLALTRLAQRGPFPIASA